MPVRFWSGLLNLNTMDYSLRGFLNGCWIIGLMFLATYCANKSTKEVNSNVIYNRLSNDNWGTSTDRDTIDEEYRVVLTKDSLTITELVPGSVFFKNFVKDTTITTITFALENGGFKSNEYWANLTHANAKLKIFDTRIDGAYVQATSSIVRIVLNLDGWAWSDTYYFWGAEVNRPRR